MPASETLHPNTNCHSLLLDQFFKRISIMLILGKRRRETDQNFATVSSKLEDIFETKGSGVPNFARASRPPCVQSAS